MAGLTGGLLVALAPSAAAHPLGNFTVSTADRLLVEDDGVRVVHAVDHAEIPTLQLVQSADGPDADRDGSLGDEELASWAAGQCARTGPQLQLVVDGARADLSLTQSSAASLPGQAGLATLRLDCTFDTDAAASSTIAFDDPTGRGRTGWKEVSAAALCGSLTGTGGLPQESPSGLLSTYPEDLLASPLDVTSASFGVQAGGACRAEAGDVPAPSTVLPRGIDRLTSSYTDFVGRQDLTLPFALLAVLLSVVLGCGHAVAPGHGKTVIAAYLVGQRGTRRQAVWLGATVTATHTAGVLLLGAVLSLTSVAAPERFVPATEVASGLLLAGVGVFLLRRAVRARRGGAGHSHDHGHDHPHGDHEHSHGDHDHDHDHPHGDHEHSHGGHDHPHGGHDHDHSHGGHDHPHGGHDHDHPHGGHDHDHPHDDEHGHAHDEHEHERQPVLVPAGAPQDGRQAVPSPRRAGAPVVHSHGGRAHSHLPLDDAPLGWRTLATMGVAGGLVPSPSALVVLLGAAALGRPVFGALLVVGYGVGMALTLTVAGLLLLRARATLDARGWSSGRSARIVRLLPLGTAAVVLAVGALVVARGLLTFRGLG